VVNEEDIQVGERWFASKGWEVKPFQMKVWRAVLGNRNGLLNTPTGSGKTLALFTPILLQGLKRKRQTGLFAIWVTPLRSLAEEISQQTQDFARHVGVDIQVQVRNGDTPTSKRKSQQKSPPFMLVITPESLHLLLSYKESHKYFADLGYIIVDEWHELLSNKRGVQVELAVAALRAINPKAITWGISATIGNLEEARNVLMANVKPGPVIKSKEKKRIDIKTVLPNELEELSFAGHYGTRLAGKIIDIILASGTTLIFTNTRAQCESWYQHLVMAHEEMPGQIALHHGSLSKDIRMWVEGALRSGSLKAVVCTSSLDLGVDFPAVDNVIQIGGAKGVARFVQRAGRSGHHPGGLSTIHFVPTHALEIIEGAALRDAIRSDAIEERRPLVLSFDVLAQFVVTMALCGRYTAKELKVMVKTTHAFGLISDDEWTWITDYVRLGSRSLRNYNEYKKVTLDEKNRMTVDSRRISSRHRMHIGTIVSDNMMHVKFQSGGRIGAIEEWFISKLSPGDTFIFTGRVLELIRIKDMEVHVRRSKKKKGVLASFQGGRLPLSARLGGHIRAQLSPLRRKTHPEKKFLDRLFQHQARRSMVPTENQLLIETVKTREGFHFFCFPFEGKFVHEAMAALLAYRIGLIMPITFSLASSDYGFELLSAKPWDTDIVIDNNLLSASHLFADLTASLNTSELAGRKFRDISAISGMVFQGYPGANKKARHMQASGHLLFKVFEEYEPENLLFRQSYRETFEEALEEERLRKTLVDIEEKEIVIQVCEKPSPFSFPILADRLRGSISSEKFD